MEPFQQHQQQQPQETLLVSKLIHLLDHSDTDVVFEMLTVARHHLSQQRSNQTYVAVVFASLKLAKRIRDDERGPLKIKEDAKEEETKEEEPPTEATKDDESKEEEGEGNKDEKEEVIDEEVKDDEKLIEEKEDSPAEDEPAKEEAAEETTEEEPAKEEAAEEITEETAAPEVKPVKTIT